MARTVAVLAVAVLGLIAVTPRPAQACSCAEVSIEEVAADATFAFVGSEVARNRVAGAEWPSNQVVFAVSAWLSHVDGPDEFVTWTGDGSGDCGVSSLRGEVGVLAWGSLEQPTIDSCGSIHPPGELAAVFVEPAGAPFPIPFEPSPDPGGGGSSYLDLLVPAGAALLAAGALAGLATRRRRRRDLDVT